MQLRKGTAKDINSSCGGRVNLHPPRRAAQAKADDPGKPCKSKALTQLEPKETAR